MTRFPRVLAQGLALLYEDRDIIAVDKPAGLLSVAVGGEREKTAYWILAGYLRKKGEKRRPAAVHRLDRDTSGVMLFAKSAEMKRALMENWDDLVKVRRYTALAEGVFAEKAGTIDAPLGEDRGGRVVVTPGGKRAVTHWKVIKQGRENTLLELELDTGRRNQIRAHLAWLGHPVVGDRKYHAQGHGAQGHGVVERGASPVRLCLHAASLSFLHPRTGALLEFTSPLPGGFAPALRRKPR